MTTLDTTFLDGNVEETPPLRFEEAWASIMSNSTKRAWAFNHHTPSAQELLRARDNQPFSKKMFLDVPSDSPTFEGDSRLMLMEDLFCTCYRLHDGTSLGFVLNSACADVCLPCFSAFDPSFGDPHLTVARLIVGAERGRLYVMEFLWLKSGALTVRFGPYISLSNSKRIDLRMSHSIYAFLPSDVPMMSAVALCPGEPSDDFIHARFENILISADWYLFKVIDTCFQSSCMFCSSRGVAICGCPLPMQRRLGNVPKIIGYRARVGKTFWEEFGTVKTLCSKSGTAIFNVTKAPNSRYKKVMDSGVMPFNYSILLNVATSRSMQLHLALTGQSARATRTVLTPFTLRDSGKRHQLTSPPSSVEDFATPVVISTATSGNNAGTLSNSSSSNEIISLIRGVRKRARVEPLRGDGGGGLFGAPEIDGIIDATSTVVDNFQPLVTEALTTSNIRSDNFQPLVTQALTTSNIRSNNSRVGSSNERTNREEQQQKKVYPCPECGALIKNKMYNLKRHIQVVHQKERKFGCTIPNCGQRFQTKTNLKRHVSTVHKRQSMLQNQEQQREEEQPRNQQDQQLTQTQSIVSGRMNFTTDTTVERALVVGESSRE